MPLAVKCSEIKQVDTFSNLDGFRLVRHEHKGRPENDRIEEDIGKFSVQVEEVH